MAKSTPAAPLPSVDVVTVALLPKRFLTAPSTVVPVVVLVAAPAVPSPCQPRVQPPHCLASESAPLPVTRIFFAVLLRGRRPSFLSSTCDSRTAWRATVRCSGEPMALVREE